MLIRKRLIAAALLSCLLLSGCAVSVLNGEYTQISPHEDYGMPSDSVSNIQEVKNYTGLKNAVLNLVNNAMERGTIRLINYNGDEEDSISRVCSEIMTKTSVGKYAVQYMVHTNRQILSYYEAEISIAYKKSAEQIHSLQTKASGEEYYELLDECLADRENYLVVKVIDSAVDELSVRNHINEYYYDHLLSMVEEPSFALTVFRENNVQKIVELSFNYRLSEETTKARLNEMKSDSMDFLNGLPDKNEQVKAEGIFDRLCEFDLVSRNHNSLLETVYGVLYDGEGNSKGFALTCKMMCDIVGLECFVVSGTYNGLEQWWNIVKINGEYYQIDVAGGIERGKSVCFMRSDQDFASSYSWDRSRYPECTGAM